MTVHQMLIVLIILDHTIVSATTVILAKAQFVTKVGTCFSGQSVAVAVNATVVRLQELYRLISKIQNHSKV